MYVNAGKLNKRIAIYRRTEDPDKPGYLAPASDPQLVHECWAQFSQTSGTELIKANADFGEEKVRFLIRYTSRPIDRKMFVRYRGSDYDIEYINDYGDNHQYIELWCVWRSQEGRP